MHILFAHKYLEQNTIKKYNYRFFITTLKGASLLGKDLPAYEMFHMIGMTFRNTGNQRIF